MAQHETDARTDTDPLLEFAIEPQRREDPVIEPVPAVVAPEPAPPDPLAPLAARVDRLERTVERMSKQVSSLRSEVATIVGVRKNNVKPLPVSRPHARRAFVPAAIGLAAGLVAALWFWAKPLDGFPDAPASPIEATVAASSVAEAPTANVAPPVAAVEAPPPPAIVPVRHTPARETPPRAAPRRIDYLGTLSIDASPAAEVFINRRPAGRTPVRLTDLKAGSHLVWIQREGFRRFTRVVQVPADRVTRVSATLDPLGTR